MVGKGKVHPSKGAPVKVTYTICILFNSREDYAKVELTRASTLKQLSDDLLLIVHATRLGFITTMQEISHATREGRIKFFTVSDDTKCEPML